MEKSEERLIVALLVVMPVCEIATDEKSLEAEISRVKVALATAAHVNFPSATSPLIG